MNKFISIIIIVIFYYNTTALAVPDLSARTAIVIDYHSDEVLYELEPDIKIYPASMTKIMTTIIAFDLIKKNRLSLDDKFVVTENAWRLSESGYSSMFIMVNDEVSVEDLLHGIIIASGNDACVALAEVSDILKMSNYLIKEHPKFYEWFSIKEFTWNRTGGDPITQGNRNPLLYKNMGADGIKTGYLAVEKYSLASSMKKDTRRIIAVGSGFPTKQFRSTESLKLLNWGFRNTSTYEISKKEETFFELDTWLGKKNKIKAVTKNDYYFTLNKKDIRHLKVTLIYNGPIKAPIKKDQQIAELIVTNKAQVIKTLPLYASEEISKVNFF